MDRIEQIKKMNSSLNYLGKTANDKNTFYVFLEPDPKSMDSYVIFIEDSNGNLKESSAIEAIMDYGLNLNDVEEES